MKPLILAAMLLTSFSAQACDLTLVAPATSALKKPVQVKASLADGILTTSYSVTAPSLNATKVLGPERTMKAGWRCDLILAYPFGAESL